MTVALAAGLLMGAAAEPSALAADEPSAPPAVHDATHVPQIAPLRFEYGARFRLRPEMILGGSLGSSESGVPAALVTADGGDDLLVWASMRMRLEAAVHVGSPWSIHVGVDAFDNLVLGSTHVNAGGDFAGGLWRDTAAPPQGGTFSFKDALTVREIYARWRIIELVDVMGGRMTDHFGLGIARNDGRCDDCDYGSIIDGVRLGFEYAGIRLEGTYEYTATGATTARPGLEGQPYDLTPSDDVHTYAVRIGGAPPAPESPSKFTVDLPGEGSVHFDWGLMATFVDQSLTSSNQQDPALFTDDCSPYAQTLSGEVALPWSCWELVPRSVFLARPSIWLKGAFDFGGDRSLRLELEAGAMIGDAENVQTDPELGEVPRSFLGFGGVLESEVRLGGVSFGVDTGFATGDDRDYLGYVDGQNILTPDDADFLDDDNVRTNTEVTSYWFHRDYRLDLILFRQVIGGVTNAAFIKPWVGGELLSLGDTRLSGRLDVLYAAPMIASGTPGGGRHYGVEVDGHLTLEVGEGVSLQVSGGVLVPMDALADRATGDVPDPAFTLRGLFVLAL